METNQVLAVKDGEEVETACGLASCMIPSFGNALHHLAGAISAFPPKPWTSLDGRSTEVADIYKKIQENISQAYIDLTDSRDISDEYCESLSYDLEMTVMEINTTNEMISKTQTTLQISQTELKSLSSDLHRIHSEIREGEERVKDAELSLNNMKKELRKQHIKSKIIAAIAVILMLSVYGFPIGIGMIAFSINPVNRAINCAEMAVQSAEKHLEEQNDLYLLKLRKKFQILEERLTRKDNCRALKANVMLLKENEKKLETVLKQLADMSEKINKCATTLGTIWASIKVLHTESSNIYSLEPLVYPLEDIVHQLTKKSVFTELLTPYFGENWKQITNKFSMIENG